MRYTPEEMAARISRGGRKGAERTAAIRRSMRERYRAGLLTAEERAKYEHYVEQRRRAGAKGGQIAAERRKETVHVNA